MTTGKRNHLTVILHRNKKYIGSTLVCSTQEFLKSLIWLELFSHDTSALTVVSNQFQCYVKAMNNCNKVYSQHQYYN